MKTNNNEYPLHEAIKDGDIEEIKNLIMSGISIDGKNEHGHTPLVIAAKHNHIEIAKLLIENDANVNEKNDYGYTPLHIATEHRAKEIMQLLIENGANVNEKNNYEITPLHIVARLNNKEIAKLLIENGANVNEKGYDKNTSLHIATKFKNKEVTKLLIENDANVNEKNDYGYTPLHIATEHRAKEIMQLLIENGANVNAQDKNGYTPLFYATLDIQIMTILISNNADVNIQNNDGYTLINHLVKNQETEVIKLLISSNADVNIQNNEGYTPLHFMASWKKGTEIFKLILALDYIDVNIKNKDGNTPLLIAAQLDRREKIVRNLIKSGKFDLSAVDNKGNSIFTYYMENLDMLKFLYYQGADPELYKIELDKRKGGSALKNIANSSQSAHYTDEIYIKGVYPKIKDNVYNKNIDEVKNDLSKLIDLTNNDFNFLLTTLVNDKIQDIETGIGQGKEFVAKMKMLDLNIEGKKAYLNSCLEKSINSLKVTNNTSKIELLGKIISEIEKRPEEERTIYLQRLVIELIDAGSMYEYGDASCIGGIMNKCLSVLEYLISSSGEKSNNGKKNYDLYKFKIIDINFINDFFAPKYKNTWNSLKDFQKIQELRKTFFELFNKDTSNEVFKSVVFYNENPCGTNLIKDDIDVLSIKMGLKMGHIYNFFRYKMLEKSTNQKEMDNDCFNKTLIEKVNKMLDDKEVFYNPLPKQPLKQKILSKLKQDSNFYEKIAEKKSDEIEKIVGNRNLDNLDDILQVLLDIDQGKSLSVMEVNKIEYLKFLGNQSSDINSVNNNQQGNLDLAGIEYLNNEEPGDSVMCLGLNGHLNNHYNDQQG